MKRSILIIGIFIFMLFSFGGVFAEACDLHISMLNQDPYPAIQGEEATIVFQIEGVANPECGTVEFDLVENYPISISPEEKKSYVFESGTFQRDFESFFLAPFKVRVSEDAVDGDNKIEVKYKYGKNTVFTIEEFYLNVEDIRADFEVFVKDYDISTKTMTFEILNIAESDVMALTIEIPKQEMIEIKGSNRNIEGDLDANDYVTTDFEATPKEGKIKVIIHYTDEINVRRTIEKMVSYDPSYFEGRIADEPKDRTITYLSGSIILLLIFYFIYRKVKSKKLSKKRN